MNVLLPLMVTVPLGAGFLLALMPEKFVKTADTVAIVVSGAILTGALALLGREESYEIGGWAPPVGINLSLDGLSALLLVVVALVAFTSILYSVGYMKLYTSRARYCALSMIMLAGMNGVLLSGDIFNRFVYVEVAAIASYVLVGFGCGTEELKAALKYAVLGALASAITLLGIALLYVLHGTVNIAHLYEKIAAAGPVNLTASVVSMSALLFFVGFVFKSALVPLHIWQPDVMKAAPAPVSAMISGALIEVIGVYAMVRIAFSVFGVTPQLGWLMACLGMLSMVAGVVISMRQNDMRRFLAYQSISHIGYVFAAFGIGGVLTARGGAAWPASLALMGGVLHLANHAIFQSLLFLNAGAVEYETAGEPDASPSNARAFSSPVTAAAWYAGALSSAALPPFGGCVSKAMIIAAFLMSGHYLPAAVAIVVAVLAIVSFLKYHGKGRQFRGGSLPPADRKIPLMMAMALVLLMLLSLGMSLLALGPLRGLVLEPAQASMVNVERGQHQ